MSLELFGRPPTDIGERRTQDQWGAGYFGAARAGRTHNGIDILFPAGSTIMAAVTGTVTKIGMPYADDIYRYVQITDKAGNNVRCFYVLPTVRLGQRVYKGDAIGLSQDLTLRYPGDAEREPMPCHVHLEIKTVTKQFIDPDEYEYS